MQMDARVEEALRACLRTSLQDLTRMLGGAARKDPLPLLAAALGLAGDGSFRMTMDPTSQVGRPLPDAHQAALR